MGVKNRRRAISLMLSMVILFTMVPVAYPKQDVSATSKYIKVDDFIKNLIKMAGLAIDKTSKEPYIDAAINNGIIQEGEYKDYNIYLTREDCAVLANRLDEHIHGKYYGYTEEVYEFLKSCKYYNGRLCYNIKGELYPEEVDERTYSAAMFLDECVMPIIDYGFQLNSEINAEYKTLYDDEGSSLDKHVAIGYRPEGSSLNIGTEAFEDEDPIIEAWKHIVDEERRLQTVYHKRIIDMDRIPIEKRFDVAKVVSNGIIKGFYNGFYNQNYEFKGSRTITARAAKNVILKILDPEERALISPDGQLIRTTNLPENSDKYPYILAFFPNEFYETPLGFERFDTSEYLDNEIKYPNEAGNKAIEKMYADFLLLGMEPYEYYDTIINQVEQYVTSALNVDYRTVDEDWVDTVASSYFPFSGYTVYEMIDDYLKAMKKNHVIVESNLISVEPSTMYYSSGSFYVRVYARYRVSADTFDVEDDNQLILGGMSTTHLIGLKNNEWTYGFYDIQVSSSNIDPNTYDRYQYYMYFGVDGWAGFNDFPLKGSN